MNKKKLRNFTTVFVFLVISTLFSVNIFAQNVAEQLREAAANLQNNQFDEAEKILRRVIKSAPANSDAHNLLGIVLDQKSNFAEAEKEYRQAVKLNPKAVSPLANLGILLAKTKREKLAAQTFESILKINPNHPQTIINLGFLHFSLGNFQRAAELLQKAAQIQPNDYEILFKLGTSLYQIKKTEAAKQAFSSANSISPTNAEPFYSLGVIAFDEGNFELASQNFEKVLALEPNFADAYFMFGEILAKQKRYEEAVKFYEKAAIIDKTKSVYFVRLGGTYLYNYEPIKAFQYFKEAVELFPEIAEIRYFYAISARSIGNYELAFSEAKKSLSLNETADANALLGSLLTDRSEYAEAEKYLRKAIALNPNHINSQHDLGRILVKEQKFTEALPILQKVSTLIPDDADIHYQLFLTYTRLKRKADADKEFALFKKLSDKK
ncbi:MAG TPA: tetratricopeptide repeat protein [Pyrinomonadaceae bacterium]|nr:tetratricopeptide repeat protein [Pyrinomonadaceae bacterium]